MWLSPFPAIAWPRSVAKAATHRRAIRHGAAPCDAFLSANNNERRRAKLKIRISGCRSGLGKQVMNIGETR
jgi:hypothetical protein